MRDFISVSRMLLIAGAISAVTYLNLVNVANAQNASAAAERLTTRCGRDARGPGTQMSR